MTEKWAVSDYLSEKGVKKKYYFQLKNNKIISKCRHIPQEADKQKLISLDGVVTPSLFNAHTHLELTERLYPINRQLAKKELWDWIIEVVKEKRSRTEKEFEKNIKKGERYLLKKGIGRVLDIRSVLLNSPLFFHNNLKGIVFFEVLGYDEAVFQKKWQDFLKFYDSNSDISRIGLSIHSLYTTPIKKAKELVKFAKEKGLIIMMHMGEKAEEKKFLFENDFSGFRKIFRDAMLPSFKFKSFQEIIDYLELGSESILVHCTQFTEKDFEEVKKRDVNVVVCPRSNLYFTGKMPNIEVIIDLEIKWAIGSDSLFTNKNLSVFEDGKLIVKKFPHISQVKDHVLKAIFYGYERITDKKDNNNQYLYFENNDLFNSKYRWLSEVLNGQSF